MSNKLIIQNPEDIDVVLEDLKCMNCKKLLSVGPIYYEKSVGNICGRCVRDVMVLISSGLLQRATTYEQLAKHFQFPCSNTDTCEVKLNWGEVLNHERSCSNKILCPMNCCAQLFDLCQIRDHTINNHPDYYKTHNENITFQLSNVEQLCFTEVFDQIFFIRIHCITSTTLNCMIKCIPKTTVYDYKLYTYTIEICPIHGGYGSYSTYDGDVQGLTSTKSLDYVMSTNGYPLSYFTCNIVFKKKSNVEVVKIDNTQLKNNPVKNLIDKYLKINVPSPTLNLTQPTVKNVITLQHLEAKILEELECPICINYMKKRIYICTTGHSICDDCSLCIQKCPLCNSDLLGGRNFLLERLSELPEFPCKFAQFGCQKKFNNNDMKLHRMNCAYRILDCPTEVCKDKICLLKMRDHLKEFHPALLFKEDDLFKKPAGVQHMSCHYTIVDDQLFVFKIQCEDELNLKFDCIQVCLTDASKDYKFKLQFSGSNYGLELVLERLCKKDLALLGCDPLIVPMSLVQPFVVDNPSTSFQFKCLISKV